MSDKINLLVNLPPGFFRSPTLRPLFRRLERFARVRRRSHNTDDEIRSDLAWAEVVLMWSWPALMPDLLDAAPELRMAAQIDLTQRAARVALQRGLPVSVSRAGFSPAVAEMALTLMLTTLRKVSDYHAAMRRGREAWVRQFPDDIDPLERQLSGRNVGIIGYGRIGRRLHELLRPFGCTVRVSDPHVPRNTIVDAGAEPATLMQLVRRSEVVVLAAASNPRSQHLLGRRQIEVLPRHAVLVNVSRAALVDTDALVARLRKDDLFAAIDVFDTEPLPRTHPLRRLPGAYLTPHRAGGVMESVHRTIQWLIDDIEAHLANRQRRHALTEAMLPALDA
jgi:phosphoglycerate dehydrogenase-like enzyme